LRQESSLKRDEVYNIGESSEQQMIGLGNISDKEGSTKEADTVVVIINTDHSQENTL